MYFVVAGFLGYIALGIAWARWAPVSDRPMRNDGDTTYIKRPSPNKRWTIDLSNRNFTPVGDFGLGKKSASIPILTIRDRKSKRTETWALVSLSQPSSSTGPFDIEWKSGSAFALVKAQSRTVVLSMSLQESDR